MSDKRVNKALKKKREDKPSRIIVEALYVGNRSAGEAFCDVIYQDIKK